MKKSGSYLLKTKNTDAVQTAAGRTGENCISFMDNRPARIVQRKDHKTGLPDNLKSGIEHLSGHSMDDVKVHYNSAQPAQLNAHAYAQGTDIHIAPGQEKHLPHEAWHVVQQKQGRVKPTIQLKGIININDDKALEKEADIMGINAVSKVSKPTDNVNTGSANFAGVVQRYPYTIDETEIKDYKSFKQFLQSNRNNREQLRILMDILNHDLAQIKFGMAREERSSEIIEAVKLRGKVAVLLEKLENKKMVTPFEARGNTHLQSTLRTDTGQWQCHCFVTSKKVKVKEAKKTLSIRCSMSLSFIPLHTEKLDPACKKIGLVQIVKRQQGGKFYNEGQVTKEGEAKGYHLDRSKGQNNPLFGRPEVNTGYDQKDEVNAETESYQVMGGKGDEKWTPAILHDPFGFDIEVEDGLSKEPVLSDLTFETSAFCIAEDESFGRFLGSVKWGCIVFKEATEVILFGLFPGAKATPSIPFRESAKEWNKLKRPGLKKLPENYFGDNEKKKEGHDK